MSRIDIKGTIENIKSKNNVYSPVFEAIVNSIQAIIETNKSDGEIIISLNRENILEFDNSLPEIVSLEIYDNGIGFNQENRDSFDTFYSQLKKDSGGKGFGRFMFVKYFEDVQIESVFLSSEGIYKKREFKFGSKYEIIVDETIKDTDETETYTKLKLQDLKKEYHFDKNIETFSKKILEKLLVYFVDDEFNCPNIIIEESNKSDKIILNNYLKEKNEIQLIKEDTIIIKDKNNKKDLDFSGKVFKIYYPGNKKSKICLTAHNRSVIELNLTKYIPEFEDDFFDKEFGDREQSNYIIRTYILGKYLDENVSLEREEFNFPKDSIDMHYGISQNEIEIQAAEFTKTCFEDEVNIRVEKKKERIRQYVNNEAPWHKAYLKELTLDDVPYKISDEDIESVLQSVKFKKENETRKKLKSILSKEEYSQSDVSESISEISEIGKSDLAHYVFNRKCVLDALTNYLKRIDNGKAYLEEDIHNLIYPMRKDSEMIEYEDHNLWLLDERLVFSEYIASDLKISKDKDALGEPDLLIFDQKKSFRNGDNEFSNPLTIFEFKRPKRESYTPADDPILQIAGYLENIREGKYEMPEGLETIKVNEYTPVYGYVIADLTAKIREFARNHQLTLSPDGEGYFGFHTGYKIYIEIISYKKLLKDATLRNKIFFKKLCIE